MQWHTPVILTNTWESEEGGYLWVPDQPDKHSELQDSQDRDWLQKQNQKKKAIKKFNFKVQPKKKNPQQQN